MRHSPRHVPEGNLVYLYISVVLLIHLLVSFNFSLGGQLPYLRTHTRSYTIKGALRLNSGPVPPLHGQSVSAESFCRRFIRFPEARGEQRASYPTSDWKEGSPPLPLFELVGQLPPPAGAVSTGQAGGSLSFRCSFQWGQSTLSVHAAIKGACV